MLLQTILLFAATIASGQSWEWAIKPIGLASTSFAHNSVVSVDIDDLGYSYIIGNFNDSATFSTVKMKSVNVLDIYVAKLNPNGALVWVRTIGGPFDNDQGIDVTLDPAGNAYIAGYFRDSLNFDGLVVRQAGSSYNAIAKYNANGDVQWARLAEGQSAYLAGGIAYSPTGHFYFGCGHTFAKYTLDGDSVWTIQIPLASNSFSVIDVAVDREGHYIYMTGSFSGAVDIGGVILNSGSLSNWDIFVAKCDEDGNVIWAKQAGSPASIWPDAGNGIEVDQAGNVYVCGTFTATSHFETDSIIAGNSQWSMFLAKYDGSGNLDWLRGGYSAGITSSSASEVRLVSNETAVLVAAGFTGSVTFGGTTFSIFSGGDALVMKVSDSGDLLWGEQSGSTLAIITVNGMDVNRGTSSAVVVGKHSSISATFTPFVFTKPPVGSADGFIVSTSTNSPTPAEEVHDVVLPAELLSTQNYPNPFNPSTTIAFELPIRSHVTVTVCNILGEHVRTLMDKSALAGAYEVEWDGRDQNGNQVATGVYLYRIAAAGQTLTRKMMLLK
jgi:hypothetical protein